MNHAFNTSEQAPDLSPEVKRIIPATRLDGAPSVDMEFPPLSRTVTEVTDMVSQHADVPDTPRLVQAVNADPIVAASVLRRINSAYYGMRRRIGDIQKATFLLGFQEVCEIVLAAGLLKLKDVVKNEEQAAIFDEIMCMSVGTAFNAKRIAAHLHVEERDSAFTIGLLHTVGRLVLLYNRPEDYEALWCTNDCGFAPTVVSEQIIFGTDHAELGALATESWNLPEDMVRIIRCYLTPGHLSEHHLRVLALVVSVAATATEQLCLPCRLVGDEPPAFEPTAALYMLARITRVPATYLTDLIESQREEALRYIRSMID